MTPALRHAWPLITITLVNKMASIALSLLPALLVAREADTATAALAMGVVRAGSVVGTLAGGQLADRAGLKPTLMSALSLSGLGVTAMGAAIGQPGGSLWLLVLGALVAQVGMGLYPIAMRLLLVATVPLELQREAMGWQRSAANGGQVLSFVLGALLGGEHVVVLLALDATASWLAAAAAMGLIRPAAPAERQADPDGQGSADWGLYLWATAMIGWWRLTYDGWLTATAAQLQQAHGPQGVSFYSTLMVLNTVGCALLAIPLARHIDNPRWSMPWGMAMLLLGGLIGVSRPELPWLVGLGMAIATMGELIFQATGQFVWMALLPAGASRGTVFSVATTATHALRALGSALAFPVIVDSPWPGLGFLLLGLPGLLMCALARPVWRKFEAVGGVR